MERCSGDDAMTITHASGQTFPARACKTCGARDSNPVTLAAHEARHVIMSQKLSMLRGVYLGGNRRGPSRRPPGKCLDCDYVGRLVKGRCPRHYQNENNRRRRAEYRAERGSR